MKKLSTSHPNKERGQSLVELAVSLTVMLMLLTGAVETSLALFQYVTIRDAAQEGATYGSISLEGAGQPAVNSVQNIQWRVMDAANDVVTIPATNVKVYVNGSAKTEITSGGTLPAYACEGASTVAGNSVPNSITVDVVFDHPITYPFVGAMIGTENVRLHAAVTSTILSPTCP
jgi:Flp pilus assembly protein TadG